MLAANEEESTTPKIQLAMWVCPLLVSILSLFLPFFSVG